MINTSQPPSDSLLSVTSCTFSDWLDTNWCVTGHQSGTVKVWKMGYSLFKGKIIRKEKMAAAITNFKVGYHLHLRPMCLGRGKFTQDWEYMSEYLRGLLKFWNWHSVRYSKPERIWSTAISPSENQQLRVQWCGSVISLLAPRGTPNLHGYSLPTLPLMLFCMATFDATYLFFSFHFIIFDSKIIHQIPVFKCFLNF